MAITLTAHHILAKAKTLLTNFWAKPDWAARAELKQRIEALGKSYDFPYSVGLAPTYANGMALLPPNHAQLAATVPLDGEYVIHRPLRRAPYQSLLPRFDGP
jgi:hypothetical protein